MKVTWSWEDGYVGRKGPFTVEIPDEDIESMDAAERDDYIDNWIRQEFENRVSYWWKPAED